MPETTTIQAFHIVETRLPLGQIKRVKIEISFVVVKHILENFDNFWQVKKYFTYAL